MRVKVVAVIPARLGSTRLPNKVLAPIAGRPMIWHVWDQVSRAQTLDAVSVATDSDEVRSTVESWGGHVLMTSSACRSGTERLVECLGSVDADLVLNVQGDEPLVDPGMLDLLVASWRRDYPDLITPVYRIHNHDEVINPNIVKVARSATGHALYFSRSPIPFVRDLPASAWLSQHEFWGHVGVYGYRRSVLAQYAALPVSPLELAEQLEQLRFLDAGYRFQTFETTYRPIAVDVAADLQRVRGLLEQTV